MSSLHQSILSMIFLKSQKNGFALWGQKHRGKYDNLGTTEKYIINIINLCLSHISQSFNHARNDLVQPAPSSHQQAPPKVIRSLRHYQLSEKRNDHQLHDLTSTQCDVIFVIAERDSKGCADTRHSFIISIVC